MIKFNKNLKAISNLQKIDIAKINEQRKLYQNKNFYEFVKEQAAKYEFSNNIAITCGNRFVTFDELFTIADQYANRLNTLGLVNDNTIIVFGASTIECFAILLAAAKLGLKVFSPRFIDAPDTIERIVMSEKVKAAFVSENELKFMLDNKAFKSLPNIYVYPVNQYLKEEHRTYNDLSVFGFIRPWSDFLAVAETESVSSDGNANFIYVKNTDAKHWISLSHYSMISAALTTGNNQLHFCPGSKVASIIPICFGAGLSMTGLTPLANGCHLFMYPLYLRDDINISAVLNENGARNIVMQVTAYYDAFTNKDYESINLEKAEAIVNWGTPLLPQNVDEVNEFLIKHNSKTLIHNSYALSEANMAVTMETTDNSISKNCGYAQNGVSVLIIDPDTLEELLPGNYGEVVYHTEAMYNGYYNEEIVYQSRLVEGDNGLCYDRTGDLGMMDEDGNLSILGNINDWYYDKDKNKIYFCQISKIVGKYLNSPKIMKKDDKVIISYIDNEKNDFEALKNELMTEELYVPDIFYKLPFAEYPLVGGRVRISGLLVEADRAIEM